MKVIKTMAPHDKRAKLEHGYTHSKDGDRYYVEGVPTQIQLRVEAASPAEAMEIFGKIVEHVDYALMSFETKGEIDD